MKRTLLFELGNDADPSVRLTPEQEAYLEEYKEHNHKQQEQLQADLDRRKAELERREAELERQEADLKRREDEVQLAQEDHESNHLYLSNGRKRFSSACNDRSSIKDEKVLEAIAKFRPVIKFSDLLQQLRDSAAPRVKEEFDNIPAEKKQELAALLHNNEADDHDEKALTLARIFSQLHLPEGCSTYLYEKDGSVSKNSTADDEPQPRTLGVMRIIPAVLCTCERLQTKKRKREDTEQTPRKKPKLTSRNWLEPEIKWRDEFSNYAVETGNYWHRRVYIDVKSKFQDEVTQGFDVFAKHARSLLKRSNANFKFEELIGIVTDLKGRFGIIWIKPWRIKPSFLQDCVTFMACNEAVKYGKLSVESAEEILEAIYLLLWRMARPLKASAAKKVVVFSQELGPSIRAQTLDDKPTEVSLIEPLQVDLESAALKVHYNGLVCVLKIGMHDKIQPEINAFTALGNQLNNVPRLILSGEVKGFSCLLMTFMEGSTLFSLIRPLDVVDTDRIISQLRDFIQDLHRLGYSHGDLHPHNILWCSNTQKVHVIDFDRCKKITAQNSKDDYVFLSVLQQYLLSKDCDFSDKLDEQFDAMENSSPNPTFKDDNALDDNSSDDNTHIV